MTSLSRRAFLILAALLAPAARLRAIVQPATVPMSVDEFLSLSQRLVGRPTLDAQLAGTYLNALLAVPGNAARLAQLARGAASPRSPERLALPDGPETLALERTIIEWWYTGAYTLAGEPRLATHTGALMWNALGMPAPGTCGSAFGAWSRQPQRTA
ncbi:MAG TPA: sugar dehydrogenase complex small subunit [Vicinamibacterales bacterium]|nr:sugar dehydrogenase complex small subunit [Vicinamibacterales bacterium]